MAGEAVGLPADLVEYMAHQAQAGRSDPRITSAKDAQVFDNVYGAVTGCIGPRLSTGECGPVDDDLLAGAKSFDLGYPKIPGRNLEGIPNANDPVMREKLRQRLLLNPNGKEQLPPFLSGA